METREIKVWNHLWNMEVTDYVRSIDGVDLHDGHVQIVKDDLYSAISDASKDAQGFRVRFGYSDMTVAELEAACDYWFARASEAADEEEAAHCRAIEAFEAGIKIAIECGAGDRATAIRWFRDATSDSWAGDESRRYDLGLPWDYDFDHGDRDFFKRQAAKAA